MEWLVTGLGVFAGVGWLAFGIIALRMSGVKRERDEADIARKEQAKELKTATDAIEDYKARMVARLEDLENEIKLLEDYFANCDTPGARRDALNRLLQATSGARRDAEDGLRGDGATA